MKNRKGIKVDNCSIKLKVCYPTCYFWRDDKCSWEEIAAELKAEPVLPLTFGEMVMRFPGLIKD